jgi:hypothetical protein
MVAAILTAEEGKRFKEDHLEQDYTTSYLKAQQ